MMDQKRKQYIVPVIKWITGTSLPILYTTSPGIGGGEDDGTNPIDAKEFDMDEPVWSRSVWDY